MRSQFHDKDSVLTLSPFCSCMQRLIAMVFVLALAWVPEAGHAEAAFLAPEQAFVLKHPSTLQQDGSIDLVWTIAPGYYLYRDRLEVTAKPPGTAIKVERPAGEQKEDPNFGAMEVYHDRVAVKVQAGRATSLAVSWQGCAEAGLCYPPQTREVMLSAVSETSSASALAQTQDASTSGAWALAQGGSDGDIQSLLQRLSLLWTVPLFFALGLALSFTPCVLPMIPILSSIVVGDRARPRRALALSLAFVLPMAATYAGLGVGAAMAGANLQGWLQNPWTLYGMGAVFVVLAASMFGFFTLQLPRGLRNGLDDASRQQKGGTLVGAAAMGFLSALLVGPCMTAPLAGTLLYIAQSGNALHGGVLLLSLGLGMGVPLVVIATVGSSYMPRPDAWMERVKGAFGFLLLATAIWMVERVVAPSVALALWGALLVALSVAVLQLGRRSESRRIMAPAAAVLMGLWGAAMWLGAAAGAADPLRPLSFLATPRNVDQTAQVPVASARFERIDSVQVLDAKLDAARAAGKPVLLDFYADWCISCKSIETQVFGDPVVQRALDGAVLLRADVTSSTTEQLAWMRAHQVLGPPTVMLFDARGQERRDARLVGEFDSNDLLKRQPVPKDLS